MNRQEVSDDQTALEQFEIPQIDLVIVDLYPFEDTVASGGSEQEIVEKIDIGGIALIRAAAKNFKDTFCVSDKNDYKIFWKFSSNLMELQLRTKKKIFRQGIPNLIHYDAAIFNHFNQQEEVLKLSVKTAGNPPLW